MAVAGAPAPFLPELETHWRPFVAAASAAPVPPTTRSTLRTRCVFLFGRTLSVMAFRLGTDPEARLADAELAAAFLDRVEHPDVVGADLAEGPTGPVATTLLGDRIDAWTVAGIGTGFTYPTPDPIARHDVVLVDAALPVASATVEAGAPVDVAGRHRPVLVEIEEDA